ncbi:SDR family oxidoreductase [Streptomyces sp. NPDC058653]|uniref:SDR family oxidoreductase n=1 Tax=Streptomyces sp. NPDC058653 TaxID=3346576 RepID=UPI003660D1B0
MTTLITGATGNLGALAVEHVLQRVPAGDLVVSVRDPEKAAGLAERGVEVRRGDFEEPESLDFTGIDQMLLISVDGPDKVRATRQVNALRAAQDAGVGRIVYTSVVDAPTSTLALAGVHRATEELIRATGIPFTFLRNAMYTDNFVPSLLLGALEHGVLAGATGDGRNATASRADLALAAAVVLTTEGHENTVYELTGPTAWTFTELAELTSRISGKPLIHQEITTAELATGLRGAGLPEHVIGAFTDMQNVVRTGTLATVHPDLGKLIGHRPASIEDSIRLALS